MLLLLQFLQEFVESLEAFFPEAAVVTHPVGDCFERTCFEAARPPLAFASAGDEAGAFKHFEVLGDCREAHGERFGKFGDRGFAFRQLRQDRPPGWIGKGGEGDAERVIRSRGLSRI